MATFTWTQQPSGFVCSYDETQPTLKDQIRALVGDVDGTPIAYLSDGTIIAIADRHTNDLYTAAAECAEACASRCLQMHEQVKQGHRLDIKNFDPNKAYKAFMDLANMLRDKSTVGSLPSYGALGGQLAPRPISNCPAGVNLRWGGNDW
jgi:hypothetical protein